MTERAAHSKNVPGDFYVEAECCTLCGVPWTVAPDLFSDDDNACWVSRQPVTPDELRRMLVVIDTQELDCIRYRGSDPQIIEKQRAKDAWFKGQG